MKKLDFTTKKYGSRRKSTCKVSACMILMLCLATGCGNADIDALVPAQDYSVSSMERTTADVQKGNLTPEFNQQMELSGYSEIIYNVKENEFNELQAKYKPTLDKVTVKVGDWVQEGDTLVSFKSEVLEKKLDENNKSKSKAALEIDHYRKRMSIDSTLDYSSEIATLNEEIRLANLYIEDINEIYASINVVAEKSGTVSFVDSSAQTGYLLIGKPIVKVVSNDGYYVMSTEDEDEDESTPSADSVDFKIGDQFTASNYLSEYTVEVIPDPTKTSEDGETATGTDAVSKGKVYLKLINSSEGLLQKNLMFHAELPEIKNALYVDKKAVINSDAGKFVYKEQEDGRFRAVKVRTGSTAGNYIIIEEGLNEGDKVSIP